MPDYETTIPGVTIHFDGPLIYRRQGVQFPGVERQITHIGQLTDLLEAAPDSLYLRLHMFRLGDGATIGYDELELAEPGKPVPVRTGILPTLFHILAILDDEEVPFLRIHNVPEVGAKGTTSVQNVVTLGVMPREDGSFSGYALSVADPVPDAWGEISKRAYG